MSTKKRFNHIDLVECIAIFISIFHHGPIYGFDIGVNKDPITYISYFCSLFIPAAIGMFFMANGFLLFSKPINYRKHYKKTFMIAIRTFVWATILVPIYMVIKGVPVNIKDVYNAVLSFEQKWDVQIFWFMAALFCMYILFPALKALYDANIKAFIFLTCVIAFFTIGISTINGGIDILSAITDYRHRHLDTPAIKKFNPFPSEYAYSYVYFCLGGIAYKYKDKIMAIPAKKRNIIAILSYIVSTVLMFLYALFYMNRLSGGTAWDSGWMGIDTIFTFVNVLAIYTLCLNYNKENKFIKDVSINTLGIYYIHMLIINLTRGFMLKVGFMTNFIGSVIYSLAVLVICVLLCKVMRKIPGIRWLVS